MTAALPILNDFDLSIGSTYAPRLTDEAGFGALRTARGCLPLVALEVQARVDGLVASTEVVQTFVNALGEAVEATYVFPLPDRAAVTRFRLEVAGRVVEGDLQERAAARRQYDQAIKSGHRAAIAEEERAGVFTVRVGNLPAGEEARVSLQLVGPLPYQGGQVTFHFPLVVAPRYIPGVALQRAASGLGTAADTASAPDASRISPPVLLPGMPNPVRLRLEVHVGGGLEADEFRSSLHTVAEQSDGQGRRFCLYPGERLDRDFVLRWRLGGPAVRSSLAVEPDAEGDEGTFLLTLVPPLARQGRTMRPRDVVFVLDRSGSMSGWKMVAARRAVGRMVETLQASDRFTIYAFDDAIQTPPGFDGLALVQATDRQRFRAAEFLATVTDGGGTEIVPPLRAAVEQLTRPANRTDAERVLVLITDGQIGNEDEILRLLPPGVDMRIFTLGVDRAVNAGFLRRLAGRGKGDFELVETESRLDEVMDGIHRRIGTADLTGLTLRPQGMQVVQGSLPDRLPDLFAGVPVLIAGRYRGKPGAIAIAAHDAQGQAWKSEVSPTMGVAALGFLWARGKVRELEDRYASDERGRAKLEREIVGTSLRFGVLSRFTAFVAVDRTEKVNPGGEQKQLIQAVELPSGWGQSDALAAQVPPPAAPCAAPPSLAAGNLRMSAFPKARRAAAAEEDAVELSESLAESEMETESVDSMLMEFDDDLDDSEDDLDESGEAVSSCLSLEDVDFFEDQPAEPLPGAAAAPPPEQEAIRPLAERILGQLRQAPRQAAGLLATLEGVAPDVEAFVQALRSAGETGPEVKTLRNLLRQLLTMLKEASRPVAAARRLQRNLLIAVETWLGRQPGGAEAFWK